MVGGVINAVEMSSAKLTDRRKQSSLPHRVAIRYVPSSTLIGRRRLSRDGADEYSPERRGWA